jgi:hypothetical protein
VQLPTDVDTNGLDKLDCFSFPVLFTPGGELRAHQIAVRTHRTIDWLGSTVPVSAIPPLFVLSSDDWPRAALTPHYGLPHVNRSRIVVAQDSGPIFVRIIDNVRSSLNSSNNTRSTGVSGKALDLSLFADLLICHELTHLADRQSNLEPGDDAEWGNDPRALWFCELFANLALQGYVATNSPRDLGALETLYEITSEIESEQWRHTSHYDLRSGMAVPGTYVGNHCWVDFRLQLLARDLWRASGAWALEELHAVLHGPLLNDHQMIDVLAHIDIDVARSARHWLHNS